MASSKSTKTKSKQPDIEFRLRERERFLRTLISNLPGVVFRCLIDERFTKEFISDGCLKLTGYQAEELVGANAMRTWSDLIHPEDLERVGAELSNLIESHQLTENGQFKVSYRLIARDGQIKHVRDRFQFVRDAGGEIIALEGFINDVTERLIARERARESEDRYRLLAENMRDLVCLHALDGTYIYVSPSSKILLGYDPEELVGKSPYDLIHPDDIERIRDEAHAALLSGKVDSIVEEYRIRDRQGTYCWLETMTQTVVAPDGQIIQFQTVSRDISKRKEAEAEREAAQEELARLLFSEKEARHEADVARVETEHASRIKDEFLQMVSHEFRTPLTTIKTLVRVLQHDDSSKADRSKHLETIAAECDRQIDMILNLLDVSRLEEGDADLKHEPVDVNRILHSCDRIERPASEARRQTLMITADDSLPPVCGDEKAIRRALCTIIENAVKYTPESGMITVSARHIYHHTAGEDRAKDKKIAEQLLGDLPRQMDFSTSEQASAGEEIAVVICDTGRGILPADIPKVFKKFYRGLKPHADSTTDGTPDDAAGKAETPGVGLGLYLAKRLISALDGRITVHSEVGRGSCFTIFLPIWNERKNEKDTIDEYDFDESEKHSEKTPAGS